MPIANAAPATSVADRGFRTDDFVKIITGQHAFCVVAFGRYDFVSKVTGKRCVMRPLMRTRSEFILHFTADVVHFRQHFCSQPHHTGSFCDGFAQAGMEIYAVIHRHVTHVFHAANQADLCVANHNGARRIMQCLHRRAAQTIDGGSRYAVRDLRQ